MCIDSISEACSSLIFFVPDYMKSAATITIMLHIPSAILWISVFTNLARVQIWQTSAMLTIPYNETIIKRKVRLYYLSSIGFLILKYIPIKVNKMNDSIPARYAVFKLIFMKNKKDNNKTIAIENTR